MGSVTGMKEHYLYATEKKWTKMVQRYDREREKVLFPLTVSKDNALHLAVHSKERYPLSIFLDWAAEYSPLLEQEGEEGINVEMLKNAYGNTVLHDAAVIGNFEAVKLLVDSYPKLQHEQNAFGESPLFRAASFGQTKIVTFLAENQQLHLVNAQHQLLDVHRKALHKEEAEEGTSANLPTGTSILHATVQGEFFETAWKLLRLDKALADPQLKDGWEETTLHRLSNMHSAFKSGSSMGLFTQLFYFCLPVYEDDDDDDDTKEESCELSAGGDDDTKESSYEQSGDPESNRRRENNSPLRYFNFFWRVLKMMYKGICNRLCKGWPMMQNLLEEKKKHKFAFRVAKVLIKEDCVSWNGVVETKQAGSGITRVAFSSTDYKKLKPASKSLEPYSSPDKIPLLIDGSATKRGVIGIVEEIFNKYPDAAIKRRAPEPPLYETPLFTATRKGLIEVVSLILKEHPQAVEHINGDGQNIWHVAVMHRQRKIFDLLMDMEWAKTRLTHVIDINGYTLLHYVADTQYYTGGTMPGPALQLHEELVWYDRVEEIVPSYYKMHREYDGKRTAEEIFDIKHAEQLKNAERWTKETAQSCSVVSVLVATVVFAAAYTVPGGADEHGVPVFINSPYFLIFTVMDVVSLASSLTSVVMFLSILTSTGDKKEFRHSLPYKLTFGWTLLFISVVTTMFAFGSTIVLIVRSDKKRTTSLISAAAFFPVSVFALLEIPLYVAFLSTMKDLLRSIWKTLPSI